MSSSKRDADQNSEYDQSIGRIVIVNIVMKTFINCWKMLKLSSLVRNRKIEINREIGYAEIKAYIIYRC
jgi:hypothetical protein